MTRLLFICKQRQNAYGTSYGLLNSCKFLCNMLETLGVQSQVVSVVDNNCIDKEVYDFKPTHVFVEALWVVPSKFEVLLPKYSKVKWYVRTHSNSPFISNEGMAFEWFDGYNLLKTKYDNFNIAPNSLKLVNELKLSMGINCDYTPNIYKPLEYQDDKKYKNPMIHRNKNIINIACFGAIRPMKNQLLQAMAAIGFADEIDKILHFHINCARFEQYGEPIYRNIKNLFVNNRKHKLIEHSWVGHEEFIKIIKRMDIGMQVSFTETFNIVSADFAYNDVPLVGSREVEWLNYLYKAHPTEIDHIIDRLWIAHYGRKIGLQELNKCGLISYNLNALEAWKKLLSINFI